MDYGPLFDHIEPKYHGSVTNFFLEPVRRGVADPEQVVLYVMAHHSRARVHSAGRQAFGEAVAQYDQDGQGRLALARWAIWWESLHPAVREELKRARRQPFIESWRAGL